MHLFSLLKFDFVKNVAFLKPGSSDCSKPRIAPVTPASGSGNNRHACYLTVLRSSLDVLP